MTAPVILDHSIVGQSLTDLTINKDREFAGCRICGAMFQSRLASASDDPLTDAEAYAVHLETLDWRRRHNRRHTERERQLFLSRGLTFTPEAALVLAPFGLVALHDAVTSEEVAQAMLEAPRVPTDSQEDR